MEHELTKYTDSLYYAALRLTEDPDEAEEITQEAFLAAWQSLSRGYQPDNLWAWLNRVLSNKFHDRLRYKYRHPTISYDVWMTSDDYREPSADDEADETDEQLEQIRREIGYLARTHREVFVRFYMRGESIDKIASEMGIPVGTVKSRLNKGRQQVRKGVEIMENYAKQSYEPEILRISCSGECGPNDEPFSLVGYNDTLTQNILIVAYEKPLTEVEIAKALGVPAAYVEPVVNRLVDGELMARTDGGKVYSDFIQYTRDDRYANFKEQLAYADEHYGEIKDDFTAAMDALRETEYYKRQDEHSRRKLELHYAVSLMSSLVYDIASTVSGEMPYSEYPYRKNGGRWIAMANHYPANYDYQTDADYWKYSVNGEFGSDMLDVYGLKLLGIRCWSTELGEIPSNFTNKQYIKWMYELYLGESSGTLESKVLESADALIDCGLLKKDGAVTIDIPVLTQAEYNAEKQLAAEMGAPIMEKLHATLAEMIRRTCVKIPAHLKSVPKWQQYFLSRDSLAMAFIFHAFEDGIVAGNANYRLPAAVLIVEK